MVQGEDVGPFGVIVRDRSGPGNDWDGQRFWGVLVERSAGSSAVSAAARLWSLSAAIVGKGTTLEPPPPPRRAPPGVFLSRGTGGRWSDRAKAAYKSWRDYILAVKGKIRLRVTLSTQSESAAFRQISLISSSGDL